MTQPEYDTFEHGIGTGFRTEALRSERGAVESIRENSPIAIHGVALPENTVLQGGQGVRHYYPPPMAERAAEVLQQQLDADEGRVHIVKNFHELEGQASADDIIGEVTAVGYSQGVGVTFQGEITDETTAEKIDLGYLDVSPTVARALGEEMDPQMEARPVSDVGGFRDIAVVGQGQPGADVDIGTNPAIEALHRAVAFDGDAAPPTDTYAVSDPEVDGWSTAEWDRPTLSETFGGDMEAARNSATWIEGDGEEFSNLKLFVLNGDGECNTNALDAAWRMASQTDGPTEDDVTRLRSLYEQLAERAAEDGPMSTETFEDVWQSRMDGDAMADGDSDADADAGTDPDTDTMSLDDAKQTLAAEYDLAPEEIEARLTTDADALEGGADDDPDANEESAPNADGGDTGGDAVSDDRTVLLVEAGDGDGE